MSAYANTALENQELSKIRQIIRLIYPMINIAEAQQVKNKRIKFRYDWLRHDLASIQHGIEAKLHGVLVEPRTFKPIHGDYVQLHNGD
jgi:RAQPRD family integrative conjugative element protein